MGKSSHVKNIVTNIYDYLIPVTFLLKQNWLKTLLLNYFLNSKPSKLFHTKCKSQSAFGTKTNIWLEGEQVRVKKRYSQKKFNILALSKQKPEGILHFEHYSLNPETSNLYSQMTFLRYTIMGFLTTALIQVNLDPFKQSYMRINSNAMFYIF